MGTAKTYTERDWQQTVVQLATICQWKRFHPTAHTVGAGSTWRSDGKGYPDLTLVSTRGAGIIFVELKTNNGTLTDEQREWGEAILRSGGEYYVWRPRDLDKVRKRLEQQP
jgi:hypothetical protein